MHGHNQNNRMKELSKKSFAISICAILSWIISRLTIGNQMLCVIFSAYGDSPSCFDGTNDAIHELILLVAPIIAVVSLVIGLALLLASKLSKKA